MMIKRFYGAIFCIAAFQIPTPRWTLYDAKYFGATIDARAPETIQDRAYS